MNYYDEYFTTESLVANNTITLTIGSAVTTQCITYIAYSKDKTNWTSITPTSGTDTISVTLNANEKAYWKGDALSLARSYGGNSNQSIFSSTGNYKVYGNIASLLYADSFTGKFYFPEASSTWNYRNFQKLFYLNTYLVDAKGLIFPFKKYPNNCCANMFERCPIVNAPQMKLDNTNHGNYALENMFRDCTSLVDASSIEINGTINRNCIDQMFRGCSSLTKAPKIGAITTAGSASLQLFYSGCKKLNYIINLDPNPDSSRYVQWARNVSATGIFIKHPDATWEAGENGIPSGWTVKNMNPQTQTIDYNNITAAYVRGNISLSAIYGRGNVLLWGTPVNNYATQYFTAEIITGGTLWYMCLSSSYKWTLEYSKNNGTWYNLTADTGYGIGYNNKISVNAGDKIRFRKTGSSSSTVQYSFFWSNTCTYELYGNVMSLAYGDNFIGQTTIPGNYYFNRFCSTLNSGETNTWLKSVENLVLPATTLTSHCYDAMFAECTQITKAPVLPATTLVAHCYDAMFGGCIALRYIKAMFTTTPGSNYTQYWVVNVPSGGTFVKNSAATWNVTGSNGVPSGWTIEYA